MDLNIMINLKQFHDSHNNMTQFGQAGVLHKIFEIIGTTNKYFVEFGSEGTDTGQGNSASLRPLGFEGLLMDAGDRSHNKYKVYQHFITAENINELFIKYQVPEVFDFLSIDIDGNDFYVWQRLDSKYRPRVLSIESNPSFPKNIDVVPLYDPAYCWRGENTVGSSAKAIYNLCRHKKYSYVAHCGVDGIFIADEVIIKYNMFSNVNNFEYIYDGPIYEQATPPSNYIPSKELLNDI
jgi:hypothetical protein